MSISIKKIDGNELHCHYNGQTEAQGCYVKLDCKNETLSASYNAEIGNAIPFSVYHGHDQRFGIPCLTGDAANDLLDEIAPLAERVIEGYTTRWDGNNNVADFTDDAQAAIEEITEICDAVDADETNSVVAWDVGDWLDMVNKPNAETSDNDLNIMVVDAEPDEDNIVINGDIEEYYNNIRYDKRRDKIESVLYDLKTVDEYDNTSDDDENPVYLVRFKNGRCAIVQYNTDGKMIWKRSPLRPDDLSKTAIGRAYCDLAWKTKIPGGNSPRVRPLLPATDYDAARCKSVPEPYKTACKKSAINTYNDEVQKQFKNDNTAYFENKKQRMEINAKIAELEQQLDTLKKMLPKPIEPEYFSMAMDSAACRYFNLVGEYPHIEK